MITIGEATHMKKIYTENIIHCPICNRNSNFIYVVKKEESKYYLGTKCSHCDHYDDFQSVPSRIAQDYPAPQK